MASVGGEYLGCLWQGFRILACRSPCRKSLGRGGSPQYNWLVNDLSNVPSWTSWKIAFFHYPPYSSGAYSPGVSSVQALTTLFDQYKVDLVLNGHDHIYQRSYALSSGSVVSTANALDKGSGTIYVVTGGGGRSLYDFTATPGWLAARQKQYHFLKVTVSFSSLQAQSIATDTGAVGGSASVVKSTALSLNSTAVEVGGHVQLNVTTIPNYEGDFSIYDLISGTILFQTHNKTIVWKPERNGLLHLTAHPVGASVGSENATYLVVYGHEFNITASNSTAAKGDTLFISGRDISVYNFMPWEDEFVSIIYTNQTAKAYFTDKKAFELGSVASISGDIHVVYMENKIAILTVKIE